MEHNLKSPFQGVSINFLESEESFIKYAKSKFAENNNDAFFVVDMARVLKNFYKFKKHLPRCEIFYAMKCNSDPNLIKLLQFLGCGLDVASKEEIQFAEGLTNCPPDKFIFSNPHKYVEHIQYAKERNIKKTTFDCVEELDKIKKHFPEAEVILRIKTDGTKCTINLSKKFGAERDTWEENIKRCKQLGLNFAGVSFHVGSDSHDTSPFADSIEDAAAIFNKAEEYGFHPYILDIGGGFPGQDNAEPSFEDFAKTINDALEEHFSQRKELLLLAEPGRYFAAECFYLFANVVALNVWETEETSKDLITNTVLQKYKLKEDKNKRKPKYFINDSSATSLSNAIFEKTNFLPKFINRDSDDYYLSDIYGYCSCGHELISKNVYLPKLKLNEYIYFENMGAYTTSIGSGMTFNGYSVPSNVYYCWIDSPVLREGNEELYENILSTLNN